MSYKGHGPLVQIFTFFTFLAHPGLGPMSLCRGEASVVRPASSGVVRRRRPQFTKNASSLSFLNRFRFRSIYLVELNTVHKTSIQNFEILITNELMG